MKICLIDGNPREDNAEFEGYLDRLVEAWKADGHELTRFDLRKLDIRSCTGCWTCWWKKPGLCVVRDDSHQLRQAFNRADLALFATPLVRGFASALLKDVIDKLIPLALPYITLGKGEMRHIPRYERRPDMACLLQTESDTSAEDVRIVSDYFERMADQFESRFRFSRLVTDPVEEVCRETDRV